MKKNRNSIFQNMMLQGITWRLGSFFYLLFIFVSVPLFASENPSSETFVHANPVVETAQTDQVENNAIHVAEGTVIFGLDSMSQKVEVKHFTEERIFQKAPAKKNISDTAIKKITQKVKAQNKESSPEATAQLYSHQSESSFQVSKQQCGVGTLAFNHSFKAITVHYNNTVSLAHLSKIIAIHKYAFSFTPNTMHAHSFSRPPPFI